MMCHDLLERLSACLPSLLLKIQSFHGFYDTPVLPRLRQKVFCFNFLLFCILLSYLTWLRLNVTMAAFERYALA